jgi:2-polyprenyl-3-methyl-5-hydroxy-6-metoxy-1,4-benzoquinol methylase
MRDKFLSYLSPGSTILDVGCGTGRDAKYFIQQGHYLSGIDICETFITGLQNTTLGKYIIGDIVDPSSAVYQEKYDAVWCNAAIVHLEREEAQQVMKN